MEVKEKALSFQCGHATLIGVLHLPQQPRKIGLLTVVAGGPQYRAGVCRQLVTLGRELADHGIAVMRFDHTGLGDSVGEFRGFEHMENDIESAIKAFRDQVPELESIVLWGGCDAASGILINAWRYPEVTGLILGNPFVSSFETKNAVTRQHYRSRIMQRDFWMKLLSFKYNPLDYLADFARAKEGKGGMKPLVNSTNFTENESRPFQERMLMGLQRYDGDVLFLMSGRSLVSKEFDELVRREPEWEKALSRVPQKRLDLPEADQAFSTENARKTIIAEARKWLLGKI